MNVLHITTHMGGGIGNSLSSIIEKNPSSTHILVLQKPQKTEYIDRAKALGAGVYICPTDEQIEEEIMWSDVVVINWWHNPRMCELLYHFPAIACRLVLFCHISGGYYPYLNPMLAQKFDRIMVTSKCVLDNKFWTEEERTAINEKAALVYGMGKLSDISAGGEPFINKRTDEITIGYVGTLTNNKMHPDFPLICEKVIEKIPKAHFYIIGDKEDGKWIEEYSEIHGLQENIHLMGYVENAKQIMKEFDIFAYPLNSLNYATTENAILEAMYEKCSVVLMNQGTEKYIVTHNKDGLLADDIDMFAEDIVYLCNQKSERKRLGDNARKCIEKKFDFYENIHNYLSTLEDVKCNSEKKIYSFREIIGENPYQWMMSGVNPQDRMKIMQGEVNDLAEGFKVEKKSSVYHFYDSYSTDLELKNLVNKLKRK